jgi:hypothetical protein
MKKLNLEYVVSNKITQRSFWQLRSSPFDFQCLFSQYCLSLCFDGDSKQNLGEAGVGGGGGDLWP